jgi:hypothetical protein
LQGERDKKRIFYEPDSNLKYWLKSTPFIIYEGHTNKWREVHDRLYERIKT